METLKDYLKYQIDKGNKFAYTTDTDLSLLYLLKNEIGLKQTREAAERAAAQDYRVEESTTGSSGDRLIEEGKVIVWDLKEELLKLE